MGQHLGDGTIGGIAVPSQLAKRLLQRIESARVRVNLATDDVRQRIALLAHTGAEGTPLTYGR